MTRSKFYALTAVVMLALSACSPNKAKSTKAQIDAGQAFLARNAKAAGVHVLPDGLQYKIVTSGPADGPHPRPQDEVKVNYEGKLLGPPASPLSGQVFDSSFARGAPASFPLGGLVPGWVEALQLMRPGDEWMLYVPASLGYGDEGSGPIPAGSTLIFRIQLLGVLPHADGPPGG
jgi:peptidylprolyl isomerase/FKBP-type peptidyl-prolyl cis-trans isomerase FklB